MLKRIARHVRRFLVRLPAIFIIGVCAVSQARAQTTALAIDSQPGDVVGEGRQQTWTDSTLEFAAWMNSDRTLVVVTATAPDFSTRWSLAFAAPAGALLGAGTYENATRYDLPHVGAGLAVNAPYKTCALLVGRFVIHEMVVGPTGSLTRFAADFEQHCWDVTPALFGAIRYQSTRSSLTPFDGDYPEYWLRVGAADNGYVTGPGIDCGAGRGDCSEAYAADAEVSLQAFPSPGYAFIGWAGLDCLGGQHAVTTMTRRRFCVPIFSVEGGGSGAESPDYSQGAFFMDGPVGYAIWESDRRVSRVYVVEDGGLPIRSTITVTEATENRIEFRIAGPGTSEWHVSFAAPPGEALGPGSYAFAVSDHDRRGPVPAFALSERAGSCGDGARFVVHEIEVSGGVVPRFAADFEVPCGSAGALTFGSIRHRSTRTSLLPFDGAYPSYVLHIVSTIGGYVESAGIACGDGGRTDCDETYGAPATVALRALASSGYQFLAWGAGCSGDAADISVTIDHTQRCFAVFTPAGASTAPADSSLGVGSLFIEGPESIAGSPRTVWLAANSFVRTVSDGKFVRIEFHTPAHVRTVEFRAPNGADLIAGDYDEAFMSGAPAFATLDISGCWAALGRFRIHEASYDSSGALLAFSADFEAFCGFERLHLAGAVRYASSRSRLLPFDGAYPIFKLNVEPASNGTVTGAGIDCGPGRGDCSQEYGGPANVALQATPAPGYRFVGWTGACDGGAFTSVAIDWVRRCSAVFGAVVPGRFADDPRTRSRAFYIDSQPGEEIGRGRRHVWLDGRWVQSVVGDRNIVSFHIHLPEHESWWIVLRAPTGADLQPGVYENAVSAFTASATQPGIYVSGAGRSCVASPTGRFVVYEIAHDGGAIASFAADFALRCGEIGPVLFGAIRYNSSRAELRPFPPTRASYGPADLNGDGWADLVWQNRVTGELNAWFMSSTAAVATAPLWPSRVSDTAWHIVGRGDADRDGYMDLFWQHQTTGALAIWYMFETVQIRGESLSPGAVPDTQWKVRAVADMNKDGYPDLIWQHVGTGHVAVWFMQGSRLISGDLLSIGQVSDLNWRIAGAGDAPGVAYPDLFWHHTTSGELARWSMRGRLVLSGERLIPDRVSDTSWQVRGVGDLNRDGLADLIWQNTTTLQVAGWLLEGRLLRQGLVLGGPALPSSDWHLVSPK